MFKKRAHTEYGKEVPPEAKAGTAEKAMHEPAGVGTKNTILKGNRLIGDISVSCDLEMSGEIEGNITSELHSNIVIKGLCRGSIFTREGSIEIEGELQGGNLTAGSNITISGRFQGGEAKAQGRIRINGEFSGKLEAGEIEIGSEARGSGEIFYKDAIAIAKGAIIEGQICKLPAELTLVKNQPPLITEKMRLPDQKKAGGA